MSIDYVIDEEGVSGTIVQRRNQIDPADDGGSDSK
jgi:hypothetical protein